MLVEQFYRYASSLGCKNFFLLRPIFFSFLFKKNKQAFEVPTKCILGASYGLKEYTRCKKLRIVFSASKADLQTGRASELENKS